MKKLLFSMPALMPCTAWSLPTSRRSTSARTSSKETSVKTAIGLERVHVPDALALGATGGAALRPVARRVQRQHLVAPGRPLLGLHHDALGLAAHPQFLDAHRVVLDDR